MMTAADRIHDVRITDLEQEGSQASTRLTALRFEDHLLRRFGALEVVKLEKGTALDPILRHEADEIWVLLEGDVECTWRDLRDDSPTRHNRVVHRLTAPVRLLVPFGVAFGLRSDQAGATLLRVSTHEPTGEPRAVTWDDLLED